MSRVLTELRAALREVADAERAPRMLELWRGAKHREERYGALWLAGDKRARAFQDMDALPMYEEMIVTGAWWDYVDDIASHRLGALRQYAATDPDEVVRYVGEHEARLSGLSRREALKNAGGPSRA